MNRRKFLTSTSLTATGVILTNNLSGCSSGEPQDKVSYDIMKDVMKYRKFDAHCHPQEDLLKQLEIADRLGINRMQISNPVTNFSGNDPEGPDQVRKNNDVVLEGNEAVPGQVYQDFSP